MLNDQTRPEPKQARAVATRLKLLNATVKSLCELGYVGTTTTEVAKRAGVSQGALYKHFGSKQQLIAVTTSHLFKELIHEFRLAFTNQRETDDKLLTVLEELWSVFISPKLYAVLELYIAARTDSDLRIALIPVLTQHRENLIQEARQLFPEAANDNPKFEQAIDGVLMTMQGAALSAAVLPEISQHMEVAQYLEGVCRREFEAPYGEPK